MGYSLHNIVMRQQLYALSKLTIFAAAFLVCSSHSSFAFNSYHAHISDTDSSVQIVDNAPSRDRVTKSPPPSVADSCLPLLESIRHASPSLATDRNQRSAGSTAPLGLVLGVRFALSAPHKAPSARSNQARFGFWQPLGSINGDRHALAVTDYRDCQKEEALNALGTFRWKR